MGTALESLMEILLEKIDLYDGLLELCNEEKEAILENSLQDIIEIVKKKKDVLGKLDSNEEKRRAIIARYSAKISIPIEQLSLLRLSKLYKGPDSAKLLDIRKMLKEKLDLVSKIGKENKSLVEACSSSLGKSRVFLEQLIYPKNEYSANGKSRSFKSHGRMLNSKV